MKTISIKELHDQTGHWLRRVGVEGEIVVIDRGTPVARMVPPTLPATGSPVVLLASLQRRAITRVRRLVLSSDYQDLPPSVRDDDADGATELTLDDERIIHFVAQTEQLSVYVAEGPLPEVTEHSQLIEPTGNVF